MFGVSHCCCMISRKHNIALDCNLGNSSLGLWGYWYIFSFHLVYVGLQLKETAVLSWSFFDSLLPFICRSRAYRSLFVISAALFGFVGLSSLSKLWHGDIAFSPQPLWAFQREVQACIRLQNFFSCSSSSVFGVFLQPCCFPKDPDRQM